MYISLVSVLVWVDNLSTHGVHSAEDFCTDVAVSRNMASEAATIMVNLANRI